VSDDGVQVPYRGVSRRRAIQLGAVGLAALAGGAGELLAHEFDRRSAEPLTVDQWARSRGEHFLVAHRGSGDVLPEHSMAAYRAAVGWGARCMEVSVDITSDGVLVCMHDLSYDRTTTGHGLVSAQPSSVLSGTGILQPQLGPVWTRSPLPRVPLLEDVLTTFGHRLVLCLEAKDDAAYEPMMAMVERLGLRRQVIVKAYRTSKRIEQAKRAGYPVFAYLAARDLAPTTVAALAARLDPRVDCLVLPATTDGDLNRLPDRLVREAVAHGVAVWVYPVHRRSEAAHYFALGVRGAVCSSYGYVAGAVAPRATDTWAGKAIAPGEMTRRPADPTIAARWTGTNELLLAVKGRQHFLTLGQLSPIPTAGSSYRVEFEACWRHLPDDLASNLTLAFGHDDDEYYEHHLGTATGYHALSRPDGRLELFTHTAGNSMGTLLGSARGPAAVQGQWMQFRLDVSPLGVTWTRLDRGGHSVSARSSGPRGGYLHLGRSAVDKHAELALRHVRVS